MRNLLACIVLNFLGPRNGSRETTPAQSRKIVFTG